jgi:xylitol oxidase
MKRKEFIKTSATAIVGGIVLPYIACSPKKKTVEDAVRKNWAGNYAYKATNLYEPTTVTEVQELVKKLNNQKALGSRHCFNDIADSPGSQVSVRKMDKLIEINPSAKTLTVEAGARYGDFCEKLYQEGFALHNLASLPHITVAGACTTATHGSGVTNGNLATAVAAVELVTPKGELVNINRSHPDFNAIVVGLGAFGIITKVVLDIQNKFDVRQDVFQDIPFDSVVNHFDEIMSAGYSVSLFTNWRDKKVSEVWVKRRMDAEIKDLGKDFFGATAATKNLHPVIEQSAESCSEQLGVPGPWYSRLPHFKMGFTPSTGNELQSEFFVAHADAVKAIQAVESLREEIYPHLFITEIRTIAADSFWLSPCYKQDSVTIHFTWKPHTKEVMTTIPKIESVLAPFNVKPHWGKIFTIDQPTLKSRYGKFDDFISLAKKYDPNGKFINVYLQRNLFGGSVS